jgi:hypothetical protein
MASPEEQAVAFKNDGNKAFSAHDWPTAIDFYTKAIELDDKKPVYYSNRAQVCLKRFNEDARVTDLRRQTSSLKPTAMLLQMPQKPLSWTRK